jgi:hypothetical protein
LFVPHVGGPPNLLGFPVKDPLRETYQGRWKELPVIQKVGVIVVLGFWCVFIAVPGAFFLLLRRYIR